MTPAFDIKVRGGEEEGRDTFPDHTMRAAWYVALAPQNNASLDVPFRCQAKSQRKNQINQHTHPNCYRSKASESLFQIQTLTKEADTAWGGGKE